MDHAVLSKRNLTNRGWKIVYASLAFGIFALLVRDLFILVGALALGLLLLYEVRVVGGVIRRLRCLVKVEPDRVEAATFAGKPFGCDLELGLSTGLPLRIESPIKGGICRFSLRAQRRLAVGRGVARMRFEVLPRLAGQYGCEELRVWVRGRLGLAEGFGELPFSLTLKVYPRVLATAVAAARFLLTAGGMGVGEQPTPLRGAGLDYADSREYLPGDSLRRMDWKATARLGRLVVKEFYVGGGAGVSLAYEAVAPDHVSLDELSAAFLNSVLAAAEQGLPLGLMVHDGERVWLHIPRVQPALAVALALRYALQTVEVPPEELYGVLEPKTASDLRRILEGLDETPLRELLQSELRVLRGAIREPYRVLEQILIGGSERAQFVLASSLSRDPLPVLELVSLAQHRGCFLLILQPTRPWIGARSLEEAYRLYERYARLNRIFISRGVPVAATAERLSRHVSAVEAVMKHAM